MEHLHAAMSRLRTYHPNAPPYQHHLNATDSYQKPIWAAVAAMDIATEILLFAMPIWIVWDLQMILSTKLLICATFALRLP